MEGFLGQITPVTISLVVSGLVQWIKAAFPELKNIFKQLIAVGLNLVFVMTYHLLEVGISVENVFQGFIYGLVMGLVSIGYYSAFIDKPREYGA